MDCHMTLPRMECVAAAATMRSLYPLPDRPAPADYERVLRPVYGLTYGLAQGGVALRANRPSERAWRTLSRGDGRRPIRRAALRAAIPAGIWGLNRLLRAEFTADISAESITRSGVDAAAEMARRLQIHAPYTITGHTHRGGPTEGEAAWIRPDGGQLHNTGSWNFATAFHRPGTPPSAYWPGTVTWLDDEGPPRNRRLLLERQHDELRTIVARQASSRR
jgi:hypothetical protein